MTSEELNIIVYKRCEAIKLILTEKAALIEERNELSQGEIKP